MQGYWVNRMIKNRIIGEAEQITEKEILQYLDGLPI